MSRRTSEPGQSPTGVRDTEAAARLLERIHERGIRFINLEFTDVIGMAKSVTIPAELLPDVFNHGRWFDGSSIEGFARMAETDMYLRPDLATFTEVPWRASGNGESAENTCLGRFICDVLTPTGERFEADPRAVLVAALEAATAAGYRYEVSPELEFFLLREREGVARDPLPHDRGGYFDLSTDEAADLRREISFELGRMGIVVEGSHHEVAAGQHEVDLAIADALVMADAVVTARYAIKAIAQRHGLWATFLPKPFYGINGSGMHTHQRLVHLRDGRNAFADPDEPSYGLSPVGRQFIAGQLAHARGMTAVLDPLVNSYKRLVQGYEAPVMITWGRVNRDALVRVPRMSSGAATEEMRVELRSPDPSCNPYLAFAVMLRAGLDGIQNDLPLPHPVEEGLYMMDEQARVHRGIGLLPASLGDALTALQGDEVVMDALGQQIAAWIVEAKSREWNEFRLQVHQWELDRYLPVF